MPRKCIRETNWGSTPLEEVDRAVTEVKGGISIRAAAKESKIDSSTRRRVIKKKGKSSEISGVLWNSIGKESLHRRDGEGACRPHKKD